MKVTLDVFVVFALLLTINLCFLILGISWIYRTLKIKKDRLTKSLRRRKLKLIVNKDYKKDQRH